MGFDKTLKLRELLASIPAGQVEDREIQAVQEALMECWKSLTNSSDTSMHSYKLEGRMEAVTWEPPLLSFNIERHGRTVNLSTRADLHRWTVDTSTHSAKWEPAGHRQLEPAAKPFKAALVAEEIVALILDGKDDPRLKWIDGRNEVVVAIADIVPSGTSQQTMTSRRKRFRQECEARLIQSGWGGREV